MIPDAEILAALKAIIDGAEGRSLTDAEVERYEQLEQLLPIVRREAEVMRLLRGLVFTFNGKPIEPPLTWGAQVEMLARLGATPDDVVVAFENWKKKSSQPSSHLNAKDDTTHFDYIRAVIWNRVAQRRHDARLFPPMEGTHNESGVEGSLP